MRLPRNWRSPRKARPLVGNETCRICSISTSSTSEIAEEMPYLATRNGASIMKPVPMTGI